VIDVLETVPATHAMDSDRGLSMMVYQTVVELPAATRMERIRWHSLTKGER
jgi:hypothetical protein